MASTRKSRPQAKAARATGAGNTPPVGRKPAGGPKSGKLRPAKPAICPLDGFVEAAARVLSLPVEPQWHAAIMANLETTLRLAAFVAEFALPDETEPAPVFTA